MRLAAHCLRHFYGTELVAAGADLRVAQELMRHSMLSTTAIYVGVADTRKRAAIELLKRRSRPLPGRRDQGRGDAAAL